jgi:hypothetical protein
MRELCWSGASTARGPHRHSHTSRSKPKLIGYFLAELLFADAAKHCGGEKFIALDNTRPIEFLSISARPKTILCFGWVEQDVGGKSPEALPTAL